MEKPIPPVPFHKNLKPEKNPIIEIDLLDVFSDFSGGTFFCAMEKIKEIAKSLNIPIGKFKIHVESDYGETTLKLLYEEEKYTKEELESNTEFNHHLMMKYEQDMRDFNREMKNYQSYISRKNAKIENEKRIEAIESKWQEYLALKKYFIENPKEASIDPKKYNHFLRLERYTHKMALKSKNED